MFLTEALPPIADVDEETESGNSCVFGEVSLQTNHNMAAGRVNAIGV